MASAWVAPQRPRHTPFRSLSSEWEVDCFSRPVMVEGKKLWEVLVTDATGEWRDEVRLSASEVNSVRVRAAIEQIIARAPVKPTVIRFFRRQMVNMLTIALNGVADSRPNLKVLPSRSTHALFNWLEERDAEIYPSMEGYSSTLVTPLNDRLPGIKSAATRLPEALRAEKYAFVTLPVAEILPGGSITNELVSVGKLLDPRPVVSKLDNVDDLLLPGLLLLSKRHEALALGFNNIELAAVRADPNNRQLVVDVGLDDAFLLAKLDDQQRAEAAVFERCKAQLSGIHFLGVQDMDEDAEPSGFWLLREFA